MRISSPPPFGAGPLPRHRMAPGQRYLPIGVVAPRTANGLSSTRIPCAASHLPMNWRRNCQDLWIDRCVACRHVCLTPHDFLVSGVVGIGRSDYDWLTVVWLAIEVLVPAVIRDVWDVTTRSSALRTPGLAAHTAGIAFSTRAAVAVTPGSSPAVSAKSS